MQLPGPEKTGCKVHHNRPPLPVPWQGGIALDEGMQMGLREKWVQPTWEGKLYPSGAFCLYRTKNEDLTYAKESFVSAGKGLLRGKDMGEVRSLYGEETLRRWWKAAEEVDMPTVRAEANSTAEPVRVGGAGGYPPLGFINPRYLAKKAQRAWRYYIPRTEHGPGNRDRVGEGVRARSPHLLDCHTTSYDR